MIFSLPAEKLAEHNRVAAWWTPAERVLLVVLPPGRGWSDPSLERVITLALARAGVLRTVHGRPVLNADGGWSTLDTPPSARYLLSHLIRPIRLDTASPDPNAWTTPNTTSEDIESLIADVPGLTLDPHLPASISTILSGTHSRGWDVPPSAGILTHPVHGETQWLEARALHLPPPSQGYAALKGLFAGLGLAGPSHAALYCYLLGAFHANSLTSDRPILFIDSWAQGRGKSQLCRALAYILDGQDRAVSIQHQSDAARDELVSHYLRGRFAYVDNLDGRRGYNNSLIASLSTGTVSARAKYDRETSSLTGCLISLNAVFGACSFHPDLLSRFWRVELVGLSPAMLDPAPAEYAQEHREQIIADALAAHARAAPTADINPASRFVSFERVAAGAYCAAFDVTPERVRSLLDANRRGLQCLAASAVESLYCHHPEAFVSPHERVFSQRAWEHPNKGNAPRLGPGYTGASALGFIYDGEDWKHAPPSPG